MPTVALFTEAFAVLSEAVARGMQVPELRRVILPHPLNDRPEEEIRGALRERLDEIVGQLVVG